VAAIDHSLNSGDQIAGCMRLNDIALHSRSFCCTFELFSFMHSKDDDFGRRIPGM